MDNELIKNLLQIVSNQTGIDVEVLAPQENEIADIRPRIIVVKQRINELKMAMIYRMKNEMVIPMEWISEYDELLQSIK